MTALLPLFAGFVLALVLVAWARRMSRARATRLYATALVIAALIYVAFAVAGGAGGKDLAVEGVGLLLYGGAAWLGLRYWPPAIAVGWAAHVAWDVLLHLDGAGARYTPEFYPWMCVSFDLVLAAALLMQVTSSKIDSK